MNNELDRTFKYKETLLSAKGGLNTTTPSVRLPWEDADVLVNFNVTPDGSLVKREGTRSVFQDPEQNSGLYAVKLTVTPRVSFTVLKRGVILSVMAISNDRVEYQVDYAPFNVRSFTSKMSAVEVFDGETPSLLILVENNTPIQLFAYYESVFSFTGTSYTVQNPDWNQLRNQDVSVFVNGVFTPVTVTATGITFATAATRSFDIVILRWYWWAEAETWFGKDFYQDVGRAGDADSDQHVQVPVDTRTDLGVEDVSSYPWELFSSNSGASYTESLLGTPSTPYQYSWSDGTDYDAETSATPVNPSTLFVTFGGNNFPNRQLLLDSNISASNNRINLDNHGFRTGDIVRFSLGTDGVLFRTALTPLSVNSNYFVKKLTDNSFELYTNSSLTTIVDLEDRLNYQFNHFNIRYGDGNITLSSSHNFTTGQKVILGSDIKLPSGLSNAVEYFVQVVDATNIKLFFDRNLRFPVFMAGPSKLFVSPTDVDVVNNIIAVGSTALLDGDRVRFLPNPFGGNTLPAPLSTSTVYFVKIVAATSIELYTTASLSSPVDITSQAYCILIKDEGTFNVRQATGPVYLSRVKVDKVTFARRRKLPFNAGTGITPNNLSVRVDPGLTDLTIFTNTPSTTRYAGWKTVGNIFTVADDPAVTKINYVSTRPDLARFNLAARIRMTNKARTFVGGHALGTERSLLNSGGYIPVYGFGRFANYLTGDFPTIGCLIQGRLVLSGFNSRPGLLLFSGVSDSAFSGEFFTYFQITDALNQPDTDPFDVNVVSASQSNITALINYQNSLFVFTSDTCYRLRSTEAGFSVTNTSLYTVSHQGALNSYCVARSESSVVMLSATGIYDVTLVIEDNFQAGELSTKVKNYFEPLKDSKLHGLPWIVYDNFNLRFLVGLPESNQLQTAKTTNDKILVFDIRSNAWSEYISYAGFPSYSGFVYRDNKLGASTAITTSGPCLPTVLRFGYHTYLDYVLQYNTAPPVLGLPPIFEYQPTYNGVLVYQFNLFELPFVNYMTYTVKVVTSLAKATIDAAHPAYFKRLRGDRLTIKLNSNPGSGKYIIAFKEARVVQVDEVVQPFNQANFTNRPNYNNICNL